MIFDTLENIDAAKYDAVVVGGGPAGLSFAMEMAAKDKVVLVLESGGLTPDEDQQKLSDAYLTDPQSHEDMLIAVARRLGGTSNLWAGRCVPYDPVDFMERSPIKGAAWPIGLNEISPFYDRASWYLSGGQTKYSDPLVGIETGDDDDFSFDRLERYSNCPAIQVGHEEALRYNPNIDIRLNTTLVDISFSESGDVQEIRVKRPDGQAADIEVATLVLACGGLETTRQLLVAQQKHPERFGGHNGPLGKYYMGHVTGEISDITFKNKVLERGLKFYVDEDGTYVRRRFVPSDTVQLKNNLTNIAFWPVVPPIADAAHRSGILSLLFLALSTQPWGGMFIAEAIRRKHVPNGIAKVPHVLNVLRQLPQSAAFGFSFLYKRYLSSSRIPGFFLLNPGHKYGLSYHAEQVPTEKSRVYLSDKKDKLGLQRLVIDLNFCEADAEPILRSHELLGDWLHKHDLGTIEYRQPKEEAIQQIIDIATHGTHQIGIARMGEDAKNAVVDQNLRVFDSRNLYLLTSAVFPTSGQCNPTLTIVAMGLRLAEHLANQANTLSPE